MTKIVYAVIETKDGKKKSNYDKYLFKTDIYEEFLAFLKEKTLLKEGKK